MADIELEELTLIIDDVLEELDDETLYQLTGHGEVSEGMEVDAAEEEVNVNEMNTGVRRRFNPTEPFQRLQIEDLPRAERGRVMDYIFQSALRQPMHMREQFVSKALAAAGVALTASAGAAAISRIKEKGLTLPGSDYVGPGNDIKVDAERHGADVVAKEHDVEYDKLIEKAQLGQITQEQFEYEVHRLDAKAILDFEKDFAESGNWQSFIGKYGLMFKKSVEGKLGRVLYPPYRRDKDKAEKDKPLVENKVDSMPPPGKKQTPTEEEEPPKKKQAKAKDWKAIRKINESRKLNKELVKATEDAEKQDAERQSGGSSTSTSSPQTSTMGDRREEEQQSSQGTEEAMDTSGATDADVGATRAGGHGGGAPQGHKGAGAGKLRMYRAPKVNSTSRVYSHVYTGRTWGLQWKRDSAAYISADKTLNGTEHLVLTSMNYLPVDCLGFYMTGAEYNDLPWHCSVRSVHVKVDLLGITSSFETGSSVSNTASTTFYADMYKSIGLNMQYPLKPVKPAFTGATMAVASTSAPQPADIQAWNTALPTENNQSYTIPATMLPIESPLYAQIGFFDVSYGTGQGTTPEYDYFFRHSPMVLDGHVTKFNAHEAVGTNIISYSYTPKDGTVKRPMSAKPLIRGLSANHTNNAVYTHSYMTMPADNINPTLNTINLVPWSGVEDTTSNAVGGFDNLYIGEARPRWDTEHRMQFIEKVNARGDYWSTPHEAHPEQPSVTFGLAPVYANAPGSTNNNAINCCATFRVQTFIEIIEHRDYFNYQGARLLPHTNSYASIYGANNAQGNYLSTQHYTTAKAQFPTGAFNLTTAVPTFIESKEAPKHVIREGIPTEGPVTRSKAKSKVFGK
uniref:Structural protein n=1 Tax=Phoenicurus auroreus ambidensovirus TaxID=2794456 RepID=A0A8A4XDS4_9VIRU|nr:MAG: structural protein [Phoenicurus auroreus ambidensovirus]